MTVTYRDEGVCCARWRSVFVAVYLQSGTLEALEAMDREEARFAAEHARFSLITIVPKVEMKRPPTGLSEKATEMMKRYGPQLVGAAAVISGQGFLASLARSVMSAATMMSRTKADTKTVASIRAATDWLGARPDQVASYDGTALAIEIDALLEELGLAI